MPSKNTSDFQLFLAVTESLGKQAVVMAENQKIMNESISSLQDEIRQLNYKIALLSESNRFLMESHGYELQCSSELVN